MMMCSCDAIPSDGCKAIAIGLKKVIHVCSLDKSYISHWLCEQTLVTVEVKRKVGTTEDNPNNIYNSHEKCP